MKKATLAEGLSPKRRLFAEHYASGRTQEEAAIAAGYSARSAYQQGYRLANTPEIMAAVKELQSKSADDIGLTRTFLLNDLMETLAKDDLSDANRLKALELAAKLRGEFITNVNHGGGVDLKINGVGVEDLGL